MDETFCDSPGLIHWSEIIDVRETRWGGAIGNGLVWAGAWMLGKSAVLAIAILGPGIGLPLWPTVPLVLTSAVATGFINGLLFSAAFALINRSRSLEAIRPFRTGQFSVWGRAPSFRRSSLPCS